MKPYQVTREWAAGNGCGKQGSINCTYARLVELFGEPIGPTDDGKVQAEWIVKTVHGNSVTFTIHDYKDEKPVETITEWSVGGRDSRAYAVALDIITGAQQ